MANVILGINSAYHEPAACLIVDGRIVAMAEEERFNRIRHGKRSLIDNSDELPEEAIRFCLRQAGLTHADIELIGYSLEPEDRLAKNRGRAGVGESGWGSEAGERLFLQKNLEARDKLLAMAPNARFSFLPHHLCHAASAYLVSPFERAAILVVDGIGEYDSTWLGVGRGDEMQLLEAAAFPHSLGFVWEKFSEFLGFDAYSGPGKVMGYAAISDPEGELTGHDYLSAMRQIFRPDPNGTFFVDGDAFRFGTDDFSQLEKYFGPRRQTMVDRYEDASVASALQTVTNDVLVHLADRLYEQLNGPEAGDPVTDICLAGGVALNCVANFEVARRSKFKRIWVQPAANDAGTALGAAALLHMEQAGAKRPRQEHAYLGPGYGDEDILAALDRSGLKYRRSDNPGREVARRIEAGEIIAWFQGRQEVGPRALGNRSIVCDPTRFDTRSRINDKVKRRESFRPFAPSVLPKAMDRFFEQPADMLAARYMLFALPLRDQKLKQVIPAVIQENGSTGVATSRIHLVEAEHNPRYAQLIEEFDALTGIPLVLNTSFNIREPIVTTPDQALSTFARSSMDGLVAGDFVIEPPDRPR